MEEVFPWVQNVLLFGFSTPMRFLLRILIPRSLLSPLRSFSLPLPCSWCSTSRHILPEIFQPAARCGWGSSGCISVTQRTSDRRGLCRSKWWAAPAHTRGDLLPRKGQPEGWRKQNTTKACLYSRVFLFHLFMGKENNRKERMWKIWSPTGEKKKVKVGGEGEGEETRHGKSQRWVRKSDNRGLWLGRAGQKM